MKALIIDDEPNAVNSVKLALEEYCPQITAIFTAYAAKTGIELIQSESPDLVFLDIQLPHMSGIELLESVGNDRSFDVVFITAFNEHAIRALRLSAIDYLLKPLNILELVSAVKRVSHKQTRTKNTDRNQRLKAAFSGKLTVSTTEGMEFIPVDEIIHVKAEGSYSTIYCTSGKPRLVSKNLGEIAAVLEEHGFFRTHKSHLINLACVKKYNAVKDGGTIELSDGTCIDIARTQKTAFHDLIGKL